MIMLLSFILVIVFLVLAAVFPFTTAASLTVALGTTMFIMMLAADYIISRGKDE